MLESSKYRQMYEDLLKKEKPPTLEPMPKLQRDYHRINFLTHQEHLSSTMLHNTYDRVSIGAVPSAQALLDEVRQKEGQGFVFMDIGLDEKDTNKLWKLLENQSVFMYVATPKPPRYNYFYWNNMYLRIYRYQEDYFEEWEVRQQLVTRWYTELQNQEDLDHIICRMGEDDINTIYITGACRTTDGKIEPGIYRQYAVEILMIMEMKESDSIWTDTGKEPFNLTEWKIDSQDHALSF